MRALRIVLVIVLAAMGMASAQPNRAGGRVVDAAGQPIRGATITVEGDGAAITSGSDGRFGVAAHEGATVIVMRDGYATGIGTVTLIGGVPTVGDIVLMSEQQTETIEVKGTAPLGAQGAARLDRKTLQRIPGTGNDLVRSLSAMPGVASSQLPLGRAGVVIRGSSPQDSKLLVDDFEVPSIYHDIGFRSIIPAEAIESLEYLPGGFDVAHGRASSGIVALSTRAGAEERSEQAELSAGEAGVLAQGSLKRGRYMIATRRSTIDMLLPALLPDGLDLALTTVPRYYDEQFRFDYKLGSKWNLRVSSVGSDDAMELYASKDMNADKRFSNRTRFVRLTTAARYHDGPWSGTLALSGIAPQFEMERGLYQFTRVTAPALTGRAELARTAKTAAGLTDVEWRAGGEVVTTRFGLDIAMPADQREGEPQRPDDPMDTSLRFTGNITTQNGAAWTSLGANLDERIRLTAGLRVDAFTGAGRDTDVAVQPRGELAVKLAKKLTARVSAGAYSRPAEHQSELLDRALTGERSTQLITGVSFEPAEGVRVQSSLYYTDRRRLVTRVDGMLGNTGRGTTTGAELLATVERGPLFGWLSYSYSHSTRIDEPGAERRLFDYDQPHSLNLAGSYKLGRYTIGARFRMHSGMPGTPVETALFDSDANIYYPAFGTVNSERAPIHHQLDLRLDRTFRWGPVKMSKFIDVQNVYLNDSVVGYFYGFDYTQRGAFRSLPIIPTAGLRGEF